MRGSSNDHNSGRCWTRKHYHRVMLCTRKMQEMSIFVRRLPLHIYIYIYIIWTNTNSENAHFMLESLTGNVKVGSQITHWASIELKSAMDIIIWIGHQPMIDVSGMYIHFIVTKLIKLYFWVTFTIQMGNNGHQNPKMNNSYIIIITSPWTLRSIQPLPQNFLLNPLN